MRFLLLKDKTVCPACHRRTNPSHFRGCANCGMMLFLRPISFQSYEDDGHLRIYWLWTQANGWIYRDHVMAGLKAQEREVRIDEPSPEYGRHITPEQVRARGGKMVKKIKSSLP